MMKVMANERKEKLISTYKRLFNSLYAAAPDWMLGRREDWIIRFYGQFGSSFFPAEAEARIEEERKRLFRTDCQILLVSVLVLSCFFLSGGDGAFSGAITRPEYGEAGYSLPLQAELSYESGGFTERITVPVRAKEPTEKEKKQWLLRLAGELPERIRGENESLDRVSAPLNLIAYDEGTGISLRWFSELPQLVSEDGTVELVGITKARAVTLRARLRLGQLEKDVYLPITVCPAEDEELYKEGVLRRLRQSLSASLGRSTEAAVRLPTDLGDGVSAVWKPAEDRSAGLLIVLAGVLAGLLLYRGRYGRLDREGKNRRECMRRDFPELVNQVVLLLNAGLVVSAALMEVADFSGGAESKRSSPLFYELSRIADRVRRSNVSFSKELMDFAQSSGIRELIRFSSIVMDNVDKGSSLAGKLEREGELLRLQQKRAVEERGRLAETRLSFPLMILLLILILIAVAPVMFEV